MDQEEIRLERVQKKRTLNQDRAWFKGRCHCILANIQVLLKLPHITLDEKALLSEAGMSILRSIISVPIEVKEKDLANG